MHSIDLFYAFIFDKYKYRYMKHEGWIMKTKNEVVSWYSRVADGSCRLHVTGRRRYQISLEGASSSTSQRRAPFLHSRWQGRSSREIVYPGKVIYICNHLLHSVNYYKTLTSQLWLLHDLGSGTDNKHFSDRSIQSSFNRDTRMSTIIDLGLLTSPRLRRARTWSSDSGCCEADTSREELDSLLGEAAAMCVDKLEAAVRGGFCELRQNISPLDKCEMEFND